jgi:hypothetical protein
MIALTHSCAVVTADYWKELTQAIAPSFIDVRPYVANPYAVFGGRCVFIVPTLGL